MTFLFGWEGQCVMTKKSYEKKEGDAMNALNRFVLFSFIGASLLSLESGTVERRVTT